MDDAVLAGFDGRPHERRQWQGPAVGLAFRQLGRSNLSDVETQALEGPDHGVTTGEIVWFEWFESALVTMRGSR